jgi:hypothetical protein
MKGGGKNLPTQPAQPRESTHMPLRQESRKHTTHAPKPDSLPHPKNAQHTQSIDALGRTETGHMPSTEHSKTQYTPHHHLLTLSRRDEQAACAAVNSSLSVQ